MAFTGQLGVAGSQPSLIELGTVQGLYFIVGTGGVSTGGGAVAGNVTAWVGIGGVSVGGAALTPTVIQVVGTGGVTLSGSFIVAQGTLPPALSDPDRRIRKQEVTVFHLGFGE